MSFTDQDVLLAIDKYYASAPAAIKTETLEKSRTLIEAVYQFAPDRESVGTHILHHKNDLLPLTRAIWSFFLVMGAAGGKTPPTVVVAKAAQRDTFRCCFSGYYDHVEHGQPAFGLMHEGARIVPFALCSIKGEIGQLVDSVLRMFAPSIIGDGERVDVGVENILTLTQVAHTAFRAFKWIVDEQGRVECFEPDWQRGTFFASQRITADNRLVASHHFPLLVDWTHPQAPKKEFLKLHAALGRVLHASGRAEEFWDAMEQDGETVACPDEEYAQIMNTVVERIHAEEWTI
ncbi:hypothetical protein HDU85_007652 [Gaertneriomyces sp. JEL0708]|nr:hypothetical protein HDU85_007652 [Gaertneriomyces sp. JEL0708]